ncbi:MAG: UDP-N-acetylmuramate dehydrogenase, partial [Spirochaetia bacterium]|nr:UDP-N-acetylmuramate dehydrogenase [Spirochaetia bacterium]
DAFVLFCVQKGWSGVECLSGIPGSVGAVPVQNVGAYGQEVSETIESVTVIDRTTLQTDVIRAADCGFAYRSSIFKNQAGRDRFVVIGVQFRLKPGGIPQIRYAELDREFSKCDPVQREAAPLAVVRECVLKLRRRKSMVIDPLDPNTRSVGSFFLNPVVSHADFDRLRALWLREHPEAVVPSFPAPGGQVKLSAAWLVEQAGFSKGFVSGGAGLSTNHALALINRGGGSGDILALASRIEKAVEALFNVRLQREPVLVG